MLSLLRSRTTLIVIVGMLALGLVIPFLVNFLVADSAPTPVTGEKTRAAPAIDTIGQPPQDITYADLGESCQTGECYRVVGVTAPSDSDAQAALKDVYEQFTEQGFQSLTRQDSGEFTVAGGGVIVQSGTKSPNPQAVATLVIAWAQPGSQS